MKFKSNFFALIISTLTLNTFASELDFQMTSKSEIALDKKMNNSVKLVGLLMNDEDKKECYSMINFYENDGKLFAKINDTNCEDDPKFDHNSLNGTYKVNESLYDAKQIPLKNTPKKYEKYAELESDVLVINEGDKFVFQKIN